MQISNGVHKILFSCGKLYLDGVQIAGEGILPPKDITFEFRVDVPKEEPSPKTDPSVLEINVYDEVPAGDYGPGQR